MNLSYNPAASSFLTADERANYAAGKTTDYQRLLFQGVHLQNHSLGLSGSTDQTQYAASLGYYDETGIVPVQRFQRYALHGTIDQQLGRRVRLGLSTNTTRLLDDDPNLNVLYQVLTTSPLASPTDASGNPVLYPNADQFEQTLDLVDHTSPYALTGAIFSQDRYASSLATERLVNAAGNFYINDKPTGAVVGQQPFGGARASGTNDKAGSHLNLLRWVSARTIKETFNPPTAYPYPFMGATPAENLNLDKGL